MKNYLLLLWVLAIVACQDNTESLVVSENDNDHVTNLIDMTITPEKAAVLAQVFRTDLLTQPGSTRAGEASKRVSTVYAWRTEEIGRQSATRSTVFSTLPDTLLYIVNFEDSCGYALVSANQLIPGVVAYIEEGTLTPNTEIDNPGFQLFLDGYKDYVEGMQNRDGVFPPSPYPWRLVYNVPPLLSTRWHQYAPYNKDCFTSNGEQAKAGCVAIAVGQTVACHRQPTSYGGHSYNWDAILQNDTVSVTDTIASNSVAELIHDIGILVNMRYGVNGSGARFDSIAYCFDTFNYHYLQDFTNAVFDSLKADISNGLPVILCGVRYFTNNDGQPDSTAHAWVSDGVAIKGFIQAVFDYPRPDYMTYQNLIHCNWGWGGEWNGYFIIGAFENMYNLDDLNYVGGNNPYNAYNYTYRHIYPNNTN